MKKKLQMTMQTYENTQFERKHFSANKKKYLKKKLPRFKKSKKCKLSKMYFTINLIWKYDINKQKNMFMKYAVCTYNDIKSM